MVALLMLAVGVVGLLSLARALVALVTRFSDRWHWSPLVAGLVVVVLGASLPEIGTNVGAGLNTVFGEDASGVAVGNIIGSCVAQVTLILGMVATAGTIRTPKTLVGRDGLMMIAALAGMFLVCADGVAARWEGILLVLAYVGYVGGLMVLSPAQPPAHLPTSAVNEEEEPPSTGPDAFRPLPASTMRQDVLLLVVTLVGLFVSGTLVAHAAVSIAAESALSQEFTGIAIGVAGGLPELFVTLAAVRRGQGELAIGTLLGSNITDPLLSFGLGALIHPVTVPSSTLWFDFVYWGAMSLVALELLRQDNDLSRREAVMLVVFFAIYLWVRLALL